MKINNNISAVIANKHLLRNENALSKSMERLSSGYKINYSKDNPSGMAISYKMAAQIRGLDRASQNSADGKSVLNTADGAIGEVTSILQRMRELAVQAANDTNTDSDRDAIQLEVTNLKSEVDRISSTTEFNTKNLLDGTLDRKVYAENVSRIQATDDVEAGKYRINVEEAAKQAVTTQSISLPDTAGYTLQNGGTVSIGGYSVSLSAGMTRDEVYSALRDGAERSNSRLVKQDTQATATGGYSLASATDMTNGIYVQSKSYGEDASTGITSDNKDLLAELGVGNSETVHGSNAQIELDNTSAFGDHTQATVKYESYPEGNRIIISDTGGFKMSSVIDPGYTGDVEYEVTDIGPMDLQVGANTKQQMRVRIDAMDTKSLYIDDVDVSKIGGADHAIDAIDKAISAVNENRSRIGAVTNRLENTISNLDNASENMNDAISKLKDTDMAEEMVEFTKDNVLQQAGTSALSQANELPQMALQLLQ